MKKIWPVIKAIFIIGGIFLLHLFCAVFFPFPINTVNIAVALLTWMALSKHDGNNLYIALLVGFLLELFVSTPFGAIIGALVLSAAATGWLLLNVFTNRSVYIVLLIGTIGVTAYRSFFYAFLFLAKFFGYSFPWNGREILLNFVFETITTAGALILIYGFARLFFKKFRPEYISFKNNPFYGR